jgi:hypothetical protein
MILKIVLLLNHHILETIGERCFMKMITRVFSIILFSRLIAGEMYAQPAAPLNLSAVQENWGEYIFVKLDWQSAEMKMEPGVFNIYRKEGTVSDSGNFKKIYSHVPVTMWVDKFVNKGTSYSYYVTAVNRNGESKPSDTAEVSLDTGLVKAFVYGSLRNSITSEFISHGQVSFIPVFGWDIIKARIDSLGNYSAHLFPGNYIILANAPGYFQEFYDNVHFIFNASKVTLKSGDSLNINMDLEPKPAVNKYVLSGSVKDTAGNPLKAMIELYNVSSNSFHKKFYTAVTDSSGRYSVQVRGGDTLVVYAHSLNKNYFPQFYNQKESYLDADRIGISADTGNINFVLVHKPIYNNGISGIVMNSDSSGVQSIILAIRLGAKLNEHRKYSTFSDSLGNYSFSNLYPGSYILLSIPQGNYIPTFFKYDGTQTLHWKNADSVVVSPSGIVTGINFTVTNIPDSGQNYITGTVKDKSGNPVMGAIVFANDDNQQTYSFGITDQNGRYTITGLVPGSYSVSSSSYGYSDGSSTTASLDYTTNFSTTASFTLTPESVTGIENNSALINSFELGQNYPNPFNPSTFINFKIPFQSMVTIKVYNILGSEVATLINEEKPAGNYNIKFNAGNLASGVYFYQLKAVPAGGQAGNFAATKKLILMK